MKITLTPIASIKPYPGNPRKNDGKAVEKVAASLKAFGFRQPIVVDADGVIIAGHTRYKAAMQLGLAKVPVHVATDLTPAQVKAYRLADNRTGQEAKWDDGLLLTELKMLKGLNVDLALTGFDEQDVEALSIPLGNKQIDEDAMKQTGNECPKCGFKW